MTEFQVHNNNLVTSIVVLLFIWHVTNYFLNSASQKTEVDKIINFSWGKLALLSTKKYIIQHTTSTVPTLPLSTRQLFFEVLTLRNFCSIYFLSPPFPDYSARSCTRQWWWLWYQVPKNKWYHVHTSTSKETQGNSTKKKNFL